MVINPEKIKVQKPASKKPKKICPHCQSKLSIISVEELIGGAGCGDMGYLDWCKKCEKTPKN